MPFEGHGQNGYDAKKGKYVASWVDIFATQIIMFEGTYDEQTRTLTLEADVDNPVTKKPMKLRLATQFKDDDTRIFRESLRMDVQKDYAEVLEIRYTKRKK